MELPTYTNIWKIEKRLYKLYDFRLPMPLPVGQVAAFLAIAIPYMLALTLVGMPFSHTWVWLYVLPPGAAAWLVTRPVLEGKRLPELVVSQMRYLAEPRTWCRLAPLAEADHIAVEARVWRAPAPPGLGVAADPDDMAAALDEAAAVPDEVITTNSRPARTPGPVWPDRPAARERVRAPAAAVPAEALSRVTAVATNNGQDPAVAATVNSAGAAIEPEPEPASEAVGAAGDGHRADLAVADDSALTASSRPTSARVPAQASAARSATARPVLRVRADQGAASPLHVVERALRTSRGGWHDRVVMVPGGHRPGNPDHAQRDQARTRLPLAGPARIVVLGTTAGAGQTVTALLTGQLLASLRGEAVAVLDFGGRPGSATELARQVPRLLPGQLASRPQAGCQAMPGRERGLQVVTADHSGPGPRDADRLIDALAARYSITLADPAPSDVPRAVHVADQLVLVTPAGAASAGSLAMTLEWLDAHGHGRLARTSVTVLNGVSKQTADDADRATTVAAGRCRAIVRVPWDGSLGTTGQLTTATVHAYTALAGVLVAALADPNLAGSLGGGSASP